ncbi:hypothetical protein HMPREF1248_1563 [Coriobacteriaceae bacterium BV3Ac1]|nr:hypothetical protein HMPREF1248_1563 [Coriobacteriaceae bacterium BV3Ac1]
MRILPLAFTDATDDEIRAVSSITHAHATSETECVRARYAGLHEKTQIVGDGT